MKLVPSRLGLAAAFCLVAFVILSLARHDGWRAKAVPFGEPYLGQCAASGAGFRCSTEDTTLKAIVAPIRLKAHHDYVVTLSGHSLHADSVRIFVDFYGKDYDNQAQKGTVILRDGPVRTFVLRWSSDMPPEHASFRISNADAADFTIDSVRIVRLSSGLARFADLLLAAGCMLLALALWRDRDWLLSLRSRTIRPAFNSVPLRTLLLIISGIATLLLVRVSVMGAPMVFGDEMTYALLSASLGDPTVYSHNSLLLPLPNQLYFDLYYLATLCGDAMLAVARAMNAVVFALAAIPLFGVSRRFLPERQALVFATVVLLLPNSAYTSFFMPESLYFLAFWFVAWAFIAFIAADGRMRHAALAGLALAVLSLIKPHGLTVLLACNLVLLIALCAWTGERRRIAWGWLVLLLVFACSRGVLGVSAAPEADGTWLDRVLGMYANMLSHTLQVSSDAQALEYLRLAAINNVGSLLLLFGPALLLIIGWLLRRRARDESLEYKAFDRLLLFTLVALACLLIGTVKFTASVAPVEGGERIHQRYYDFTFGLLLLGAWVSLLRTTARGFRLHRYTGLAMLPIALIVFWYLTHEFRLLRPEVAHHPTLAALSTWRAGGAAYVAWLTFLVLIATPFAPRAAWRVYAVCFALICIGGFAQTWRRGVKSQNPDTADRAAMTLKSLFNPVHLQRGLLVAASGTPLCRTMFYLRNNAFVHIVPKDSGLDVETLAPGSDWVLAFGHYTISRNWEPRLRFAADVALYQRAAQNGAEASR